MLTSASNEFLREELWSYLTDKEVEALTDSNLIVAMLEGYVAKWPCRELFEPLSPAETSMFVAEVIEQSDSQMARAGYSRQVATTNLG